MLFIGGLQYGSVTFQFELKSPEFNVNQPFNRWVVVEQEIGIIDLQLTNLQ